MAYRFLAEDPAPCNFFRLRVCQIPFLLLVPGSLFFSLCMGWVCLFVFVWLVVGFFCIFFFPCMFNIPWCYVMYNNGKGEFHR